MPRRHVINDGLRRHFFLIFSNLLMTPPLDENTRLVSYWDLHSISKRCKTTANVLSLSLSLPSSIIMCLFLFYTFSLFLSLSLSFTPHIWVDRFTTYAPQTHPWFSTTYIFFFFFFFLFSKEQIEKSCLRQKQRIKESFINLWKRIENLRHIHPLKR